MFETDFLTPINTDHYRTQIHKVLETLIATLPATPYSGLSPQELEGLLATEALPTKPSTNTWSQLPLLISNSISVTHPHTIAHLHCPPLITSLAAEVVISALNQSMDSFDQAPAATILEMKMCDWLCREIGYGPDSGAVFTAGGTQSNFMGLLLARDACIEKHFHWRVQQRGLPLETRRLRFLCSEIAHFSVEKSAYQLGLGTEAVIKVAVDSHFRMDPHALEDALSQLDRDGLSAAAVIATEGTTDFGSIDSLAQIAPIVRRAGAWLHIDAAYGSALLLSKKHRSALNGIDLADSVSVDFHKKFWQPISCAAFALRDAKQFRHLEVHADYLNPENHEAEGIPNLVDRSLATTRRWDALKLWLTFQLLGKEKLGQMVDRTLELAQHAAQRIRQTPQLELLHQPELGCVVFRYAPENSALNADALNRKLRDDLFRRGEAVLGHTRVHGKQCLKFTCMNPMTTEEQLDALLAKIISEGKRAE